VQLLSFNAGDTSSFGAVIEGRVVDLGRHLPEYNSLKALLAANGLVRALDTAAEESPDYRLDKVQLRTPIPDAEQLLCVFDDTRDEAVSVDPKFLRGSERALRIPEGDAKPIAAGVVVAVRTTETGPEALGYMLVCYLSPATLAAGPWLTTPDELADGFEFALEITAGEQKADLVLPDPTAVALSLANDRTLETGDLVAVLHYLPELTAGPNTTVQISTAQLGALRNPVEAQPD
jgi:hypothetical protein